MADSTDEALDRWAHLVGMRLTDVALSVNGRYMTELSRHQAFVKLRRRIEEAADEAGQ